MVSSEFSAASSKSMCIGSYFFWAGKLIFIYWLFSIYSYSFIGGSGSGYWIGCGLTHLGITIVELLNFENADLWDIPTTMGVSTHLGRCWLLRTTTGEISHDFIWFGVIGPSIYDPNLKSKFLFYNFVMGEQWYAVLKTDCI